VFFSQRERPGFTPIQNNMLSYNFVYFNIHDFRYQTARLKILICVVASIT
jgi:hypothetical protein